MPHVIHPRRQWVAPVWHLACPLGDSRSVVYDCAPVAAVQLMLVIDCVTCVAVKLSGQQGALKKSRIFTVHFATLHF